ncbi:MAG: hypothetical protein F7C33_02315 [Desulfurococcales archaeon]|nr:hypothetical protein [Desulfurococcales archaeon]
MSRERTVRDIIDDIMVRFEMLDRELSLFSRETEASRGRIARVRYWVEEIEDLLIELKRATSRSRQPFRR